MPLTQKIYGEIVAVVVFFLICFLTNAAVMAVIIRHWGEIKRSPASTLSINLLLGGLVFGFLGFLINTDKLMKNSQNRSGDFLCQLEGMGITIGGAGTIVGNAIIAFERYLVILRQHKMTPLEVRKLSLAGWVWILTLGFLPIVLPDGPYVLQASEVYCLAEWWGSKPSVLTAVYLCGLTCVGALIFIAYVYMSIALLVYCQHKELAGIIGQPSLTNHKEDTLYTQDRPTIQATASYYNKSETDSLAGQPRPDTNRQMGNPPSKNYKISKKDRQIYFKVVCIASGYVLFWGPYAVVMIAGIFARSKVPPDFCIAAGLIAILNGAVNAFIIGLLDPVHKKFVGQAWKSIPSLRPPAPISDTGVA